MTRAVQAVQGDMGRGRANKRMSLGQEQGRVGSAQCVVWGGAGCERMVSVQMHHEVAKEVIGAGENRDAHRLTGI